MFMPHCHHYPCLDNRAFFTGMVFGSAFAVEAELQDRRRRGQLEKSEDNRNETTQTESGTTATFKRNR